MKLLLDQHLSRRLVKPLEALFPGTSHVIEAGLDTADDDVIWEHAKVSGFVICTKDSDFQAKSFTRGHPPKVILIVSGNGPSREVLMILTGHRELIERFGDDDTRSMLILP